jgi:hypothetical protein
MKQICADCVNAVPEKVNRDGWRRAGLPVIRNPQLSDDPSRILTKI